MSSRCIRPGERMEWRVGLMCAAGLSKLLVGGLTV